MGTIIEAGHYYQKFGPSNLSLKGWEIGKNMASTTPDASLALFVDDHHQTNAFQADGETFLPNQDAEQAIQRMMADADHVFSEAQLALGASAYATTLHESGLAKVKKGGVLSTSGVRLGVFESEDFVPTCSMLDLMLVQEKQKLADSQIVVLPESFTSQQQQVALLIQKIVFAGQPEAEADERTTTMYQTVYFNLGGTL